MLHNTTVGSYRRAAVAACGATCRESHSMRTKKTKISVDRIYSEIDKERVWSGDASLVSRDWTIPRR
jgi:hypothetical protein